MKRKLRSTKQQRDELSQCHPGVGFVVWNNGLGISEVDVCINRKTKQLCYCANGKPIELEFYEREEFSSNHLNRNRYSVFSVCAETLKEEKW